MTKLKTREDQVSLIRKLILDMTTAMAEHERDVRVAHIGVIGEHHPTLVIEVHLHPDDVGLVLGREGVNADFMRQIAYVACKKTDLRVQLSWSAGAAR